jgi:hypothetical protein
MRITEEPWGFLLQTQEGGPLVVQHADGTPVLFCPVGVTPLWETPYGVPRKLGFPFTWKKDGYQAWHLPAPNKKTNLVSDFTLSGTIGAVGVVVRQGDVTPRPSPQHALQRSQDLAFLIAWMSHGFQELAHEKVASRHARLPGQVRRTWADADKIWLHPDLSEPRMEMLIRLAQDQGLRVKLESIAKAPRRILTRIRAETPVGRIQELDAHCIRNFAQRPGRSALEKAGSRQSLLAVLRKTTHDTLENRVAVWVLDALARRTTQWLSMHDQWIVRRSRRALSVKRLGKHARDWRMAEALQDVKADGLRHPVQANYPLLLDQRYKSVYSAYLELIKYHRIEDDAWTWRRVLWSETVKQLLACAFNENWGKSALASRPYYRSAPDRGSWLGSHLTPGPFKHPKFGSMVLLDAREAQKMNWGNVAPQKWMKYVGVLGCETIIWWPDRDAASIVWSNLASRGHAAEWKASLERAGQALASFKMTMESDGVSTIGLSGLVVQTGRCSGQVPSVDVESVNVAGCCVVGVSFPQEIDQADVSQFARIVEDFHAAIAMTIEHANG